MMKKAVAEFRHAGGRDVVFKIILARSGVLRRWFGRSTLKGGALKGSMKAHIRSIMILLGEGGLVLSLSRMSEGSVTGGLGLVLALFLGEAGGLGLLKGSSSGDIRIFGDDHARVGCGSGWNGSHGNGKRRTRTRKAAMGTHKGGDDQEGKVET